MEYLHDETNVNLHDENQIENLRDLKQCYLTKQVRKKRNLNKAS